MNNLFTLFSAIALCASSSTCLMARCHPGSNHSSGTHNAVHEIPLMGSVDSNNQNWTKIDDVAQYGGCDWDNAIGRAEGVSAEEAKFIADNDPRITFFFWTKGYQMVLINYEVNPPVYRTLHHGDAVFFTGEPRWGSANGLADGYEKS